MNFFKLKSIVSIVTIMSLLVGIVLAIHQCDPDKYPYKVDIPPKPLRSWLLKDPVNNISIYSNDEIVGSLAYNGDKTFSFESKKELSEENLLFVPNDSLVDITGFKLSEDVISLYGTVSEVIKKEFDSTVLNEGDNYLQNKGGNQEVVDSLNINDSSILSLSSTIEKETQLVEEEHKSFLLDGEILFVTDFLKSGSNDSIEVVLKFVNGPRESKKIGPNDVNFQFELPDSLIRKDCYISLKVSGRELCNNLYTIEPRETVRVRL